MDIFNRREFINRSAIIAAAAAAGSAAHAEDKPATAAKVRAEGDKLRVAVVGVRGRGMSHVVRVRRQEQLRDHHRLRLRRSGHRQGDEGDRGQAGQGPEVREGHPQGHRGQGHRHRLDRHAEPLARADGGLGDAGRQGRVLREAGHAQRPRRRDHDRRRPQVQAASARSARRAAATPACGRPSRTSTSGKIGKVDLADRRCATSRAAASARWTADAEAAGDDGLRPVVRPGAAEDAAPQDRDRHRPLRLALDLGLRQRRPRQPGRPRDGQGPLGPRQDDDAEQRVQRRRPVRRTSTTARRQHAAVRVRLQRREDDLRGPRAADGSLQGRRRSATSGSAPTGTWCARTTTAAWRTTRTARRSRSSPAAATSSTSTTS